MSNPHKRWYDQDPVLSRAMEQLRSAPDKYQAQIALNIIKIIIEHQIEEQIQERNLQGSAVFHNIDDVMAHVRANRHHHQYRRWYDMHEALSSAIQLLQDCPDDLQNRVVPSIGEMIQSTLEENAVDF